VSHKTPTFVVVGHVNKGKSSVVATLLEETAIPIDLIPGTTSEAATYDFKIDGRALFRLVDTPGFQEAAAALEWLHAHAEHADQRVHAVREFVAEFEGGERFHDECQLLAPLLQEDSAGVLYVVDASRPYRATHEAEMEILRWTGRPGMALLNRIGTDDCADSWRPVLQQFFSVVREFNAHEADFVDRMRLLRTFGELSDQWTTDLADATQDLQAQRQVRNQEAALLVAEYLVEAWSYVERRAFNSATESPALDADLVAAYRKHLRKLEDRCRISVERHYGFGRIQREDREFDLNAGDLFDQKNWKLFGLTTQQLTLRAAVAGGATGGVIDLAVGGLSFGAGVALGGAFGAASAWFGSNRVGKHWSANHARLAKLFPGEHGHMRCFGPISNPAFAWVLLDRSLVHLHAVRHRSHAQQQALDLRQEKSARARDLDSDTRAQIDSVLKACQQAGQNGTPVSDQQIEILATALG
jgi:GTPase SAR1 family protein